MGIISVSWVHMSLSYLAVIRFIPVSLSISPVILSSSHWCFLVSALNWKMVNHIKLARSQVFFLLFSSL